jgi:succinate dehydrogenase / fumarate reductase membrane anchor subunit
MGVGRMSTPLARVRGLGPARAGTKDFTRQRVTAIANIPLTIAFVFIVVSLIGRSYPFVKQILGSPIIAIIMLLFLISITLHMRIGMQVIIEDYVHDERWKMTLIILNLFFVVAIFLASAFAILKLSFGV